MRVYGPAFHRRCCGRSTTVLPRLCAPTAGCRMPRRPGSTSRSHTTTTVTSAVPTGGMPRARRCSTRHSGRGSPPTRAGPWLNLAADWKPSSSAATMVRCAGWAWTCRRPSRCVSAICRHLGVSALDPAWLDTVDQSRGVFITAQGLFMYFEEADVRRLVTLIAECLSEAQLMFDVIPKWYSRKTVQGLWRTPHYKVPPMPWGLDRHEIAPLLRSWSPRITRVSEEPYRRFRTFPALLGRTISKLPWLGRHVPSVVRVEMAQL